MRRIDWQRKICIPVLCFVVLLSGCSKGNSTSSQKGGKNAEAGSSDESSSGSEEKNADTGKAGTVDDSRWFPGCKRRSLICQNMG